jgi:hypothetical protein
MMHALTVEFPPQARTLTSGAILAPPRPYIDLTPCSDSDTARTSSSSRVRVRLGIGQNAGISNATVLAIAFLRVAPTIGKTEVTSQLPLPCHRERVYQGLLTHFRAV